MPGSSRAVLATLVMGAALAAPFPVLEMSGARQQAIAPLAGATFAYSYRQSVYGVAVREELRVVGDTIRIDRALSSDIRALEYFRWPGQADDAGGGMLAWRAPDNAVEQLRIFVVAEGDQVIDTSTRRVVLRQAFGDDASVTVRAVRRPLLLWLYGLLP